MEPTLEPLETFPGIANGALDRLYLHQTGVPHTLPTVAAFERGLRRMHRLYGRRYAGLFIAQLTRNGVPEEAVRSRFVTILREQEILPTAGALAMLSSGLIGATGRSVITGVLLAARLPLSVRVFGSLADAVEYLTHEAGREGITLPSRALIEAGQAALRHRAEQALRSPFK